MHNLQKPTNPTGLVSYLRCSRGRVGRGEVFIPVAIHEAALTFNLERRNFNAIATSNLKRSIYKVTTVAVLITTSS